MQELRVDYTLEEIKQYIQDSDYKVIASNSTCRSDGCDKLLTSSYTVVADNVTTDAYNLVHTALTKDNYILNVTLIRDSYGITTKHKYFGLATSSFTKVEDVFKVLPSDCQDELRAKDWLAYNPEKLVAMFTQVLGASRDLLVKKDKALGEADEMLANAQHNMKKQPKEMFSKSWLRKRRFLNSLPWFKSILEKELDEKYTGGEKDNLY